MKKSNNVIKVFIAAIALFSVVLLNSCNKDMHDKTAAPVQGNSVDDATEATSLVALWRFDSSWTEARQHLPGTARRARFSTTALAYDGKSAFSSADSGLVSYTDAGTALPNLTTGFTVDFWVYAYPKEGGAQCIWCIPQTGAFWPTHHVLLDAYNKSQKDSALIKVMFKANKSIPYNEEWQIYGGIPNFYHHWSHVQYSYNGATSKFSLKVNGKSIAKSVTIYDNDPNAGGQPLGNLNPNPGSHGIVIGGFQNQWNPTLFGDPQPWMLGFKGRIDDLKVYNTALF